MSDQSLVNRINGIVRPGAVDIRSFDQGVVETLGAKLYEIKPGFFEYFIKIDGIDPASSALPGVPITFSNPEDVFEHYQIPIVGVRRNAMRIAQARWHPGTFEYMVPAYTANQVVIPETGKFPAKTGVNKMAFGYQATPYDFDYTISVFARHRGATNQRNQANRILMHVISIYQPDAYVVVKDSVGDDRVYLCHQDGISILDDAHDVADRTIGFAVSIRVEGELNLGTEFEVPTVSQNVNITTSIFK